MSFLFQIRNVLFLVVFLSSTINVDLEQTVEFDKFPLDGKVSLEPKRASAVRRLPRAAKPDDAEDEPKPKEKAEDKPKPKEAAKGKPAEEAADDNADPFTTNIKWANFVRTSEVIVAGAKTIFKSLTDSLSASNPAFAADKPGFLANFSTEFAELFRALPEYFEPLHEQLIDSAAYSKINPAIGILNIPALNELAKSNPPEVEDKTRIKWVEVNAMAITVHHVFDRMYDLFDGYGLEEIEDALKIGYPSWLSKNALNETAEIFELKTSEELAEHMHEEMTSLGEKDHLFRGLERILRKKLKTIDPSTTDVNFYCYGNNEFGLIHDEFDLLTDAALFLLMADIKESSVQLVFKIYKLWESLSASANGGKGEDVDIAKDLEDVTKVMMERYERKIKFSATIATLPKDVIVPGPITFKCDRPPLPEDPAKGPIITSDTFPPGVYIQNNTAYTPEGTPLKTDDDGLPLLENGTRLPVELRPIWQGPDGQAIHHPLTPNDKGEPVDENGNVVPATKVTLLIPIDNRTPKLTNPDYPMTEWGILPPGGLSPKANGVEPALDPQTGPNVTDGFIDERPPNLLAAQFAKAFSGYLEAEQVLNADGSCAGTCLDYKRPTPTCANKTDHCGVFRNATCEPGKNCMEKSNCPSKARRCIRTGPKVSFCPSAGNDTLYDWIKVNGKVIGLTGQKNKSDEGKADDKEETCSTEVFNAHERWEMEFGVILNAPQYCEVCLCVCDDPLVADGFNYFNIEEVVTNVANGSVVTAIKFEREDHAMKIMIEEGKLVGDGAVDPSTTHWITKELNKDKNVQLGGSGFKKLNLDAVYGLPFEVVTGIRFQKIEDALSLELQFTKLNSQGLMEPSATSEWRGPNYPAPEARRRLVDLEDAGNPLNQRGPSQPFSVPDNSMAVEFDASSLEKDGGNAVIPWFDLQPVQHYAGKKALASVGILYKSKRGSGGFLSPAISVYRKSYQ